MSRTRPRSIGDRAIERILTDASYLQRCARNLLMHERGSCTAGDASAWDAMSQDARDDYARRAIQLTKEAAAAHAHIPDSGGRRVHPGDTLLQLSVAGDGRCHGAVGRLAGVKR